MGHRSILAFLLPVTLLICSVLAYPASTLEVRSDQALDKRCGGNQGTTGIDYTQGLPYVKFVLSYTDKNDTQDARVVVDIPFCMDWMKDKGSLLTELDSTYNKKNMQTMKEVPANWTDARKYCESFQIHYAPSGQNNFQKAYLTTPFDATSNIGWITSDNGKAPTWTTAVNPSDTKSQYLFQCKEWYTKNGDRAYFGKGCLIKQGGNKGTCISATNSLQNEKVLLQASNCPDSIQEADKWMLWNLQHVGSDFAS